MRESAALGKGATWLLAPCVLSGPMLPQAGSRVAACRARLSLPPSHDTTRNRACCPRSPCLVWTTPACFQLTACWPRAVWLESSAGALSSAGFPRVAHICAPRERENMDQGHAMRAAAAATTSLDAAATLLSIALELFTPFTQKLYTIESNKRRRMATAAGGLQPQGPTRPACHLPQSDAIKPNC